MSSTKRNLFFIFWIILLIVVMAIIGFNFASPKSISVPQKSNDIVRIQVIINGEKVDFANSIYQDSDKSLVCNDELATKPMAFLANQNQILHLKWQDINGKIFLKNYGFENTGPFKDYLGIRIDMLPNIKPVSIFEEALPKPKKPYNLFVYTGDKFSYEQRDENSFLLKPFDRFLSEVDKKPVHESLDLITNAQVGLEDGKDLNESTFLKEVMDNTEPINSSQVQTPKAEFISDNPTQANQTPEQEEVIVDEEIIEITNEVISISDENSEDELLGNIVVFIQETEPTTKEIEDRFLNLNPYNKPKCE